MKRGLYELEGSVQHYAWGGNAFIPGLLGVENKEQQPFAELWMGTHHRGASSINIEGRKVELSKALERHPEWLGRKGQAFGALPFLFKVLDVKGMLSIQSHPNREQAKAGYEAENRAGIPIDAVDRMFKDQNHKPELMVALTDFWLLHGFKNIQQIATVLYEVEAFAPLRTAFADYSIYQLYKYVMELPQENVDQILTALAEEMEGKQYDKSQPEFWAKRAMETLPPKEGKFDRGIFSIFLFNLLHLNPGEGIYQGAGVPHAYLEGVNIELMANSDNVLRGGLTPKYVNVPQLLKHLIIEAVNPLVLRQKAHEHSAPWKYYQTPAEDFELRILETSVDEQILLPEEEAPQIILITEGQVRINNKQIFKRGEAFFIPAGLTAQLEAIEPSVLFNATLP
jgi:mannose-6-phosphate isomerase